MTKRLLTSILFIFIFVTGFLIVEASNNCPFSIYGEKVNLSSDNCIISMDSNSNLRVVFNECVQINVRVYQVLNMTYDYLNYFPSFGCRTTNNTLICNDNSISFSNWLKPDVIYIPRVECDQKFLSYEPTIIVYKKFDLSSNVNIQSNFSSSIKYDTSKGNEISKDISMERSLKLNKTSSAVKTQKNRSNKRLHFISIKVKEKFFDYLITAIIFFAVIFVLILLGGMGLVKKIFPNLSLQKVKEYFKISKHVWKRRRRLVRKL